MNLRTQIFIVLLLASLLQCGLVQADLATIYLKDGNARTVEMVSVDRGQVQWKSSSSASEIQTTLRSQIEYVAFPATGAWRDAEDTFESGRIGEAIPLYQKVIADPASHYFPMPGNYVSLAKERMLRCYRIQMKAAAIAKQAQIVREDFLNLPPEYRKVDPAVAAWSAVAKKDWEKALSVLDGAANPGPEVFYLRGQALEALGRKDEAIREYAGAYVLNFGGSVELTRAALQRSSTLLGELGDKDRVAELQAQVKLYRDLFGKGKLWEGASETLVKLSEGEIVAIGEAEGNMTKPDSSVASAAGTVAEEAGAMATLPPLEERDYILPEELEQRIVIVRSDAESGKPVLKGGVAEKEDGYAFDGTGGGIRIGSIDGRSAVYIIRAKFVPTTLDGILLDANQGPLGMGLYLKGGDLLFSWKPKRGKKGNVTVGKILEGQPNLVTITVRGDGMIVAKVNGEAMENQMSKGGLRLSPSFAVSIGYASDEKAEKGTALGEELLPFKGTIQHLSVACGGSGVEINERVIVLFSKKLRMSPPEPEAEQPSEGDAKEDAKEKPKAKEGE